LKWIRVDIDPAEIRRSPPDVAVLADSDAATKALVEAVGRVGSTRDPSRRDEIRAATARTQAAIQAVQPQMAYLNVIRELLPRDGFFVEEATQVGFTSWFGFPTYEPRTFVSTGYQGTLGFGFPTALGVKVANPDRAVISVTGDGGFLFAATELATAVQYGIGVVVLVFNNGAYGNVLRDQRERFAGRTIAAELTNPDFVKFADSFGVDAERVENPDAFRGALERALGADGPRLIEITVKDEESPWRFIHQPNPWRV
jgi:acetolactate synthase-1/2/3 large subunit